MQDEIPESVARVVGHVCGVIAVGMAALSIALVVGTVRKHSVGGLVLGAVSIGLTVLMFRWAGALTGHWDTRGRLAVPKFVYLLFAAAFVGIVLLTIALAVANPPRTIDEGLVTVFGTGSGVVLVYLSYLAYRRFK